mmetsp:Transcript_12552/g.37650  ORF Transcript_12552/g.37650 Transcript_12552/m.37650 type:complete len:304 (+) Transcript_12552:900-1811(+)
MASGLAVSSHDGPASAARRCSLNTGCRKALLAPGPSTCPQSGGRTLSGLKTSFPGPEKPRPYSRPTVMNRAGPDGRSRRTTAGTRSAGTSSRYSPVRPAVAAAAGEEALARPGSSSTSVSVPNIWYGPDIWLTRTSSRRVNSRVEPSGIAVLGHGVPCRRASSSRCSARTRYRKPWMNPPDDRGQSRPCCSVPAKWSPGTVADSKAAVISGYRSVCIRGAVSAVKNPSSNCHPVHATTRSTCEKSSDGSHSPEGLRSDTRIRLVSGSRRNRSLVASTRYPIVSIDLSWYESRISLFTPRMCPT